MELEDKRDEESINKVKESLGSEDMENMRSLLQVDKYFGVEFHLKKPEDLILKGYVAGFTKIKDYPYHIVEILMLTTDKGPLNEFFTDIDENKHIPWYFPFSEESKDLDELERRYNEAIKEWDSVGEVIEHFKIHDFDQKAELLNWMFGFSIED